MTGRPLPDYGDLMTLKDFKESCNHGCFVDDDGSGYYASSTQYYREFPASPSDIRMGLINEDFTHVLWFNK